MKLIARPMYSNPPLHGALLVSKILQDKALKAMWYLVSVFVGERAGRWGKMLISDPGGQGGAQGDGVSGGWMCGGEGGVVPAGNEGRVGWYLGSAFVGERVGGGRCLSANSCGGALWVGGQQQGKS